MFKKETLIVDYGMGNMWSIMSALEHVGASVSISSDPNEISKASKIIIPGVGSFRRGMEVLHEKGIDEALKEAVIERGSCILGICLGMQLLGKLGYEDGETKGLSVIQADVDIFTEAEIGSRRLPHIGFNEVRSSKGSKLFTGLPERNDFYFVHSYRMLSASDLKEISYCNYGIDFVAAFEKDNIYGCQFHPEKSQGNGLKFLSNFVNI